MNDQSEDEEELDDEPEMATVESELLFEHLYPFKTMSPEEWVARNGPSQFGGFYLGNFLYRNPDLQDWFHKIKSLIASRETIEKLQREYLSDEERKEVRQKENQRLRYLRAMGYEAGYFMEDDEIL